MKIGIVVCANLWETPYVEIYRKILDKYSIPYELIVWDRDLSEVKEKNRFSRKPSRKRWAKFFDYFRYASFVKKIIRKENYDKLIILGQNCGIFLQPFLSKVYKGKYILDYRDLGIDSISVFKTRFKRLVADSGAVVISSPGFKQFLPANSDYYLSHNFNYEKVINTIGTDRPGYDANHIEVLTIGGIRDYSANSQVIESLANKEGVTLHFVGKGHAAEPLSNFAKEKSVKNIVFEGFYPKEREQEYIEKATFLNIFYPVIPSHITALSNRFYNSLLGCRPMIVTKGGIQAYYAEKYHVGIAVDSTENLIGDLKEWISNNKYKEYQKRCDKLLNLFVKDQVEFQSMVKKFITQ